MAIHLTHVSRVDFMDLEVSVLTRIRDLCIQARCTVDGPTPSVYYRGAPYSNIGCI